MACNHELGLLSDMETVEVTRDFYIRKCKICKEKEKLPRAGKLWVGISIEAETLKDFERREYAKDLLQAWEPDGSKNELFEEAYGDPVKKGKAKKGGKIKQVKEEI
jgi:hypothetical protein